MIYQTALTHIISLPLCKGQFADQLKIAKVKPLYRKGCDTEVANYRPVSLITGFSKIIEKIIKKSLVSFLYKHSIISNTQHGLCKGESTGSATVDFVERVHKSLDERELSIGICLDLSRACDLVSHDILLRKVGRMGIWGGGIKMASIISGKLRTKGGTYTQECRNKLNYWQSSLS
jgi:hypothetical protein